MIGRRFLGAGWIAAVMAAMCVSMGGHVSAVDTPRNGIASPANPTVLHNGKAAGQRRGQRARLAAHREPLRLTGDAGSAGPITSNWPMADGGPGNTNFNADEHTLSPARLHIQWINHINGISTYYVVAAGRLFIIRQDDPSPTYAVVAQDATTGRRLGAYAMSPPPNSLAYAAGRLYVASDEGKLVALDAATMRPLFRPDLGLGNEYASVGGLRVDHGVVTMSIMHSQNGRDRDQTYAVDAAVGRALWTSSPDLVGAAAMANGRAYGIYSGEGCSSQSCGANSEALDDKTGRVVWATPTGHATPDVMIAGAVNVYEGVDAGPGQTAFTRALSPTGQVLWTTMGFRPVVLAYDRLYGLLQGRVAAMEAATGRIAWMSEVTFNQNAYIRGAMVVANHALYVNLLQDSAMPQLAVLDTATGRMITRVPMPPGHRDIAQIAVANGMLYVDVGTCCDAKGLNTGDDLIAFSSRSPAAAAITEYPIPTANSHPLGITAGPDGNVWFVETDGNKVGRVSPNGAMAEFPIPSATQYRPCAACSPITTSWPESIAAGRDDNLWFTEYNAARIGRITPGGLITEFTLSGIVWPVSIAPSPDGTMWFVARAKPTDQPGYQPLIVGITPAGSFKSLPLGDFDNPIRLTVDAQGSVWFMETDGVARDSLLSLGKMSPSVILHGQAHHLHDITAAPDGTIWFTDNASPTREIGRVTPGGTLTEFPVRLTDRWSMLGGITAGPDGTIWFTIQSSRTPAGGYLGSENAIARITPDGVVTTFSIPTAIGVPAEITAGPDGALWFTEYKGNKIGRLVP